MAKKVLNPKVIRTRNANTWSESEFWSKIRSALRKVSMYWKPIQACKQGCKELYTGENKRQKFAYRCSICNKAVSEKELHIDHKIAVGSLRNSDDLKGFVDRLFVEEAQHFQCTCKDCNYSKATEEKLKRKIDNGIIR